MPAKVSQSIRVEMKEDSNGGEGEIRTRETLVASAPLARECLRPLGHLSNQHYRLQRYSKRFKGGQWKYWMCAVRYAKTPFWSPETLQC